jgi:hypothetical protein
MRVKLTFNINTKEVIYERDGKKKTFKSYYTYLKVPFEAPQGKEIPLNIHFRQDCENSYGRDLNGVVTANVDVPWYIVLKEGKTEDYPKEAKMLLNAIYSKQIFEDIWVHKILDYKPFKKKEENDDELLEFDMTKKTKEVKNITPTEDDLPF